jgi:phospholipase/carboxylesterase
MNTYSDIIEIQPTTSHKTSIIWLHGLGADGYDFVDIVPQLHLSAEMGIKFIFPHAPIQPVTLNGGFNMRAWFDIYSLDKTAAVDETGIQKSLAILASLIAVEKNNGIPCNRIILAGFSQGAAIVLRYLLTSNETFAGVLALSGFLPMVDKLKPNQSSATPIFMAHGIHDNLIPINWAEQTAKELTANSYNIKLQTYATEHGLCHEEIEDIASWIKLVLAS